MSRRLGFSALVAALAVMAAAAAGVGRGAADRASGPTGGPVLKRIATVTATTGPAVAMARTPDGRLHLVYQTYAGRTLNGLASLTIGQGGLVGPEVPALDWQAGQPGLVRFPNGDLEAFFGATSPDQVSSVWGITSANGGATWSAPIDVRGGGPNEALAYGSDVTAAVAGTTPVLALPQAGTIVVQTGLGNGSPSYAVTNGVDGAASDADLATDAATGQVVAGWQSIAHDPTVYLQGVAPTVGPAQAMPAQSRNAVVLAARDVGAGVFAAYTPDGKHVRLFRYGGGSVAVGTRAGTNAKVLGVATSLKGRIWVMWGDDAGGGIAVTRSNKSVTRFEAVQDIPADVLSLYRLQSDGRLGPLDLLVDEIPGGKQIVPAGLYRLTILAATTRGVPGRRSGGSGRSRRGARPRSRPPSRRPRAPSGRRPAPTRSAAGLRPSRAPA